MKTVFFDRDGVINKEVTGKYITSAEEFELLPDVLFFMETLQKKGYQFVIITNQGGIEKGIYKKNDVEIIHQKMISILNKNNIFILATYFCPHHIDMGTRCLCRKPGSLMLEKAIAVYNIDVYQAIFIGDKNSDIEAAKKVGIKGFKINTNASLIPLLQVL